MTVSGLLVLLFDWWLLANEFQELSGGGAMPRGTLAACRLAASRVRLRDASHGRRRALAWARAAAAFLLRPRPSRRRRPAVRRASAAPAGPQFGLGTRACLCRRRRQIWQPQSLCLCFLPRGPTPPWWRALRVGYIARRRAPTPRRASTVSRAILSLRGLLLRLMVPKSSLLEEVRGNLTWHPARISTRRPTCSGSTCRAGLSQGLRGV